MEYTNITQYNPYGLEKGDLVRIKPGRKSSNGYDLSSIDTAVLMEEPSRYCKMLYYIQDTVSRWRVAVYLDCLVPATHTKLKNYEVF